MKLMAQGLIGPINVCNSHINIPLKIHSTNTISIGSMNINRVIFDEFKKI